MLHEDGAKGSHDILLLCLDPRMLLKRARKGLPDLAVKVTSGEAEDHLLEADEVCTGMKSDTQSRYASE
jgi:hypothetical protein